MSRAYCVVVFAIALVVFGVVTDVFGVLYTLSTMPGWVQDGMVSASDAGRETLTCHITGRHFARDGEVCVDISEYINDTSFIEPTGTCGTESTMYGQGVECEVFDRFG